MQQVAAQEAPWPTQSWTRATPGAVGLDGTVFQQLHARITDGDFGFIDAMVVVRNGHLVVSHRYGNDYTKISAGRDLTPHQYNYSHPDWHPFIDGRPVHTLQSVTKSITACLIGIAIGRGEIESTSVPLLTFFDEYDLSKVDERLHSATLEHLLTMRTGIEWHESDRPLNETNTTILLEASDDWIQFTLDQPMDAAPGEKWVYNSGGSHLMSGIIKKATGQHIDEYARSHLFSPLGINDFHWKKTPRGFCDTEGGLYLEPEQLAKIGLLCLREGVWEGQRILPADWVASSTSRQVERVNSAGWGYGYQWWRLDQKGVEIIAGLGYGGQYLLILPKYDLVGVVNSWNIFERPRQAIQSAFLDALISAVQ